VGIEPGDGNIAVTYQDQNGDDDYLVDIAYSYVPRSLVRDLASPPARLTTRAPTTRTSTRQERSP
jgi:hypothetical protein